MSIFPRRPGATNPQRAAIAEINKLLAPLRQKPRVTVLDIIRASDHRTAHHISGARGVLGETVHEQVDVELAMLVKSRERVVHDGQRARAPGHAGERRDIRDLGHRVGGAFKDHQPRRMRGQRPLDAGQCPRWTAWCA